MTAPPRILAIAGSDSSGGAGIQADIKTITMLGGYAMTAITAVTAQNTTGVTMVEALSPEIARVVADRLEGVSAPVVFDPVMVATSGSVLADEATVSAFDRLMKLATLTTPNVHELAALGGREAMTGRGVAYLAKGGDAEGSEVEDVLVRLGEADRTWRSTRIETRHTHGTGCTLSSAIATLLGKGLPLEQAVTEAREFVRKALLAAPGFGAGHGPMGHCRVTQ